MLPCVSKNQIGALTPLTKITSGLLLVCALSLGCGPRSGNPALGDTTRGKTPLHVLRDRVRDLALQDQKSRNEDPIDQKYTSKNSAKGEWAIDEINTSRTDKAAKFFLNLLKEKNRITISLGDNVDSATQVTVKVTSPDGKCQAKIPLDGTYCCNTMLRLTFSESSLNPEESFPSCTQPAFHIHVDALREQVNKFFTDSPTKNPMPSIFHFTHSKSGKRLRLISPPPKDRNTAAEGIETEILFVSSI